MYEKIGENYGAYTLEQKMEITNCKGIGYVFKHNKTKARVAVISNDDDNKVFNIGFRTPPKDDTGVPHITEHSVLCGSEKFPIKDPFVELVKGSLNTFLNAMTYPDKTVYPVASCNDKDFQNLMDVYMDAVFHPNIYKYKEIMKQEGWHYECESEDGPVIYNGVVYNEMKGVFSSPEARLDRVNLRTLYPDTPYFYESGGDPVAIPDLTQEQFEKFHSTYYHPSNSFIYLYGNMDVEEKLKFIDEEYLSKYDYLEVDSTIAKQPTPDKMVEVTRSYAITDDEEEVDKTFLSYNMVVGESTDILTCQAMKVLSYVILDAPGAPLKKALIDAGVGKDISSSFESSIAQPLFSITAANANENQKKDFLNIIKQTLQKLADNGLSKHSLEAALNVFEFDYREGNFSHYPKGLILGLRMFDSWLYDDAKVFDYVCLDSVFETLKNNVNTDYYENLIRTYLLDNPHSSLVVLKPEKGLGEKEEEKLKEKLAAYKASLSSDEVKQLIADTKALKEFQDREDTEEDLKKIPLLTIADIEKKVKPTINEELTVADTKVIAHNLFTNGISYVTFSFDMRNLPIELIPVSSIFVAMLKQVDTQHYSYQQLSDEINFYTGGLSMATTVHPILDEPDDFGVRFSVFTKAFHKNVAKAVSLMKEIVFTSNLSDEKRLKEIIEEQKVGLHASLMSAGHTAMANRAKSHFNQAAKYKEMTDLMDYYQYLLDLSEHFEKRKDCLIAQLKQVVEHIFTKDHMIVSVTTDQNVADLLEAPLKDFVSDLYPSKAEEKPSIPLTTENEGFLAPSQVQYVACAGNYSKKGLKPNGAFSVLKMIFSYEYLWMNIRVKGGAYGCSCNIDRYGDGIFTSYRDPNLESTYHVYEEAPAFVENFDVDERTMTKYIIGAISGIDTPMTPSTYGGFSFNCYLAHVTDELRQKERDEILSADVETIRSFAPVVKSVVEYGAKACLGNKDKVSAAKDIFDKTVVFK